MVVRDEEDILETNIRYHLAQGVDFVLAVDHGSTDATPDILREFESMGVLHHERDDDPAHDQQRRVNAMIERARTHHAADWVVHTDADEFWWPVVGNLADVFSTVPD